MHTQGQRGIGNRPKAASQRNPRAHGGAPSPVGQSRSSSYRRSSTRSSASSIMGMPKGSGYKWGDLWPAYLHLYLRRDGTASNWRHTALLDGLRPGVPYHILLIVYKQVHDWHRPAQYWLIITCGVFVDCTWWCVHDFVTYLCTMFLWLCCL